MSMFRICHVINDLPVGGAEMMLLKLLKRLDRDRWQPRVISLLTRGAMAERFEALGVPVDVVEMRRGIPSPRELCRLRRLLAAHRPDLVQTWLYHSNLLGGLIAKTLRRNLPVVWNIRMNALEAAIDKPGTFLTLRLSARLSGRLPARIVINSASGLRAHAAIGFARERLHVIPNGFELEEFRPSAAARQRIRAELGVGDHVPLIGAVGRYHPHKDYGTFLHAASAVARALPDARFLLCGKDLAPTNSELQKELARAGLTQRFHLLGPRQDVAHVHAALDLHVLSSCTEGFPNVLGEAMAAGVPCVATRVGAAEEIVGETGRIVPVRDPRAMAHACLELLQLPAARRAELGRAARRRIEQHYSLDRVADLYAAVWQRAIDGGGRSAGPVRRAAA